jgi:hypothetical protein
VSDDLPFPEAEYNLFVHASCDENPANPFDQRHGKLPYARRLRIHPSEWEELHRELQYAFDQVVARRRSSR